MDKINLPAKLRVDIGGERHSVEVVKWNTKTVWVIPPPNWLAKFMAVKIDDQPPVKRHRRKHNARF